MLVLKWFSTQQKINYYEKSPRLDEIDFQSNLGIQSEELEK